MQQACWLCWYDVENQFSHRDIEGCLFWSVQLVGIASWEALASVFELPWECSLYL
jgi:hypothetical protein